MSSATCIFDLDGTLAISGQQISDAILHKLMEMKNKGYRLILISGGKYEKLVWQMRKQINLFEMIFPESGALLYQNDNLVYCNQITNTIDTVLLDRIYNCYFQEIAPLNVSWKGERIDVRNGLIYLTPVGTEASLEVRSKFIYFEEQEQFRSSLIIKLEALDHQSQLSFVKGGKTGVSIYPRGKDKSQIMGMLDEEKIYFFGDNCQENGNDYPLYIHPRTMGYEVRDCKHLLEILDKLF